MNLRKNKKVDQSVEHGFTLVELLLVMAIIGILAGVIFVAIGPARKRARVTAFKEQMKNIATAASLCVDGGGGIIETSGNGSASADGTSTLCQGINGIGKIPKIRQCKGGTDNVDIVVTEGTTEDFVIEATCNVTSGNTKCYASCTMNGCTFGNSIGGNDGCPNVNDI